ncbi:MAG: permease-like cell division protein FtsX [Prevotella sp.]|nr:permease-like cell division protein FtsX [Prevotella sp.]
MRKKHIKEGGRSGRLQSVTLCISTALVLILLGLVVFSTLVGRNLSALVKENLVVTVMLDQDMTDTEALSMCKGLQQRPYIKSLHYISKKQALAEATKVMGTDPSEFTDGVNPFPSAVELTLKSAYANNDSLTWISKELQKHPKVAEINYQKDLVETVNTNLAKVGLVLLVLAVLLTFVSFTLINNTVRLGIYSRRFSIHTMKLVGASWGFIRRPFIRRSVVVGLLSALLAVAVLAGCTYLLYRYEPDFLTVVTWEDMAITAASVFAFGIIITALCSTVSVNKFLKMKAGDLYKI